MDRKDKIIRNTDARRVILEEIKSVTTHPTADEIYGQVRKRIPRISLGTVYRNLEILAQNGLIQKIEAGGSQKRFDATIENHYHFRCLRCGRISDLTSKPIDEIDQAVRELAGEGFLGYHLEAEGLCPSCRFQNS
ncbi:MAG: transcriptional repressor [Thermodesulfobacteriota bacterium]